MNGQAESTATDIYSLGAVLYKMVAGVPPRACSRTKLAMRWSRRAASGPAIPRDPGLRYRQGITARARNQRYGSVDEFASDVRAILAWQAVQARTGSTWYRAGRNLQTPLDPLERRTRRRGMPVRRTPRRQPGTRHSRAPYFGEVRQLANKLFDIEYETRKLPGSTGVSQFIVDTSLEYLRRLELDAGRDPSLALEVGSAYLRVARVQGVPTAHNLGQMDQAELSLRTAEGLIRNVLSVQATNRTALLRLAQISHDRMLLARYNGRYGDALVFAGQAYRWLELFQPGSNDKADASAILSTYLNVADQNARAERFGEALRICRIAMEFTASVNRPDYIPDFLWISADVHRRRGELEQALQELDESVRLSQPGQGQNEVWRTMNFALSLICRGDLLGDPNAPSLGRDADAVKSLDGAFRLADNLAHRDPHDQGIQEPSWQMRESRWQASCTGRTLAAHSPSTTTHCSTWWRSRTIPVFAASK